MKKLIIAVRNLNYVNNFSAVMPYMKTDTGVEVFFHEQPKARVHGLALEKNFDVFIEFDCIDSGRRYVTSYCEAGLLTAKEYYPQHRLPKTLQAMRLRQHLGDRILIPGVFNDFDGGRNFSLKHNHPDCEKVVIKRENGATGDRQVLIESHHLSAFLENVDLGAARLKEKFPNAIFIQTKEPAREVRADEIVELAQDKVLSASEPDKIKEDTSDFFTGQDLVITEFIDDIDEEWRIVFSSHSRLAYPRTRQGEAFVTANMDRSMSVTAPVTDLRSVQTVFGAEVDDLIQDVVKATGLLFGSIDVFLKDGQIGIFEYQNQFGIVNLKPDLMEMLHREAVEHVANVYYGQ